VSRQARLPVATGRETLTALGAAIRGRRRMLVLAALLATGGAALGLVTPAVLGSIVDRVGAGTGSGVPVWVYGAAIAGSSAGAALLAAAGILVAARALETILARLREQLVGTALRLPQQQVEAAGTGDLVSRASDDVAQVSDAVAEVVPTLVGASFAVAVTVAGTAVLDWRYALALVLILPAHAWTVRWYLRRAPALYAAERAAMATRAQHLLSALRGLDTVVAYRLTGRHSARIARASWDVVSWSLRAMTVQTALYARLDLAYLTGLVALLGVGFVLVDAGSSTIGAATVAVLFFLRLDGPIYQLMMVTDTLQSAAASVARIVGVTRIPNDSRVHAPAASDDGRVELTAVTFSYDTGHRVLTGIDLSISGGERVAVVGASGAGKTTLAALIAGVLAPGSGTVTRPADTMLIAQDPHVFAGTLRENLTLAAPRATDADLAAALAATCASALLDVLPGGLDCPVGAAGTALTTAEAQQVALARVLLADPELVIFDEATAESGSADAGLLDSAADAALRGRTALVIAHRLSQAAACDRILVMDRGRITESGTHAELLVAGCAYARLWEAWSAGQRAGVAREARAGLPSG
jgi:ATP-binding cassette subfamily C protein